MQKRSICVSSGDGVISYAIVEGPYTAPKIVKEANLKAPEAYEEFAEIAQYIGEQILVLKRDHKVDICCLKLTETFTPAGGGRKMTTPTMNRVRLEGYLTAVASTQFEHFYSGVLRSLSKHCGLTVPSEVTAKTAKEFRDIPGWEKKTEEKKKLVLCAVAGLEASGCK